MPDADRLRTTICVELVGAATMSVVVLAVRDTDAERTRGTGPRPVNPDAFGRLDEPTYGCPNSGLMV